MFFDTDMEHSNHHESVAGSLLTSFGTNHQFVSPIKERSPSSQAHSKLSVDLSNVKDLSRTSVVTAGHTNENLRTCEDPDFSQFNAFIQTSNTDPCFSCPSLSNQFSLVSPFALIANPTLSTSLSSPLPTSSFSSRLFSTPSSGEPTSTSFSLPTNSTFSQDSLYSLPEFTPSSFPVDFSVLDLMTGHELTSNITHSPQEWNTIGNVEAAPKKSEIQPPAHKGLFHNDYSLPFLEFQSIFNVYSKSNNDITFPDADLLRTSPFLSPFDEATAGYSHPSYSTATLFDSNIMKQSFQDSNAAANTDLFSLVDTQPNLPDTPTSMYSFDETPTVNSFSGTMATILPVSSENALSGMQVDHGSFFVSTNSMDIPTPPTSPHTYTPDFPLHANPMYVTPSVWMTSSEQTVSKEQYPTASLPLDPNTLYTPALFPASLVSQETRFSPKPANQKHSKLLALLENSGSEVGALPSDSSTTWLSSNSTTSSSSSIPSSGFSDIFTDSDNVTSASLFTKPSKKATTKRSLESEVPPSVSSWTPSFSSTDENAVPPLTTTGFHVESKRKNALSKKNAQECGSSTSNKSSLGSSSSLIASSTTSLPLSTMSSMKLYSCARCDKSFKRKADCIRHGRIHTGEKPYKCPGCSESFARQDALRRHQGKGNVKCANALKQYITVNSIAESPEAASLVKHGKLESMTKKWLHSNA